MKKLLLFLFVTCSLNVFSQVDRESKTVLKTFILGYDSEKTLSKKVNFDSSNTAWHSFDVISTKEKEEKIHGTGFMVLMVLIVVITVADVAKLF